MNDGSSFLPWFPWQTRLNGCGPSAMSDNYPKERGALSFDLQVFLGIDWYDMVICITMPHFTTKSKG